LTFDYFSLYNEFFQTATEYYTGGVWMRYISGYVGIANDVSGGHPAQVLFGPATNVKKNAYEPLTSNGIVMFDYPVGAHNMMMCLRQRRTGCMNEAYLARLDMAIAETEAELSDPIFTHTDHPMIILLDRGTTKVDFIGVYKGETIGFPDILGSNFQLNGLEAFTCYRNALEASRQATNTIGEFCPLATFILTKIPG